MAVDPQRIGYRPQIYTDLRGYLNACLGAAEAVSLHPVT
jgi:hypothetical protein